MLLRMEMVLFKSLGCIQYTIHVCVIDHCPQLISPQSIVAKRIHFEALMTIPIYE